MGILPGPVDGDACVKCWDSEIIGQSIINCINALQYWFLKSNITILKIAYLFIIYSGTSCSACVEVRGQYARVTSLLPPATGNPATELS